MISLDREGALWTVTLDREDRANALTAVMLERLIEIADLAGGEARAVILTGAGKVFSAGADLTEARAGLTKSPLWEGLSSRLASLPCLTIAALNGTLAGGAFGMALACDLRIAAPGASLFYPVMKLGFLPQPPDPRRLAALVGPARAKLILMAGARLTAKEAMAFGLVDAIAPASDLLDLARSLAADALGADPGHVAAIKAMI